MQVLLNNGFNKGLGFTVGNVMRNGLCTMMCDTPGGRLFAYLEWESKKKAIETPDTSASSSTGRWALWLSPVRKVLEFYDDFCNHRATSLKADGTDIRSVRMHLRAEKGAEDDADEITTDHG